MIWQPQLLDHNFSSQVQSRSKTDQNMIQALVPVALIVLSRRALFHGGLVPGRFRLGPNPVKLCQTNRTLLNKEACVSGQKRQSDHKKSSKRALSSERLPVECDRYTLPLIVPSNHGFKASRGCPQTWTIWLRLVGTVPTLPHTGHLLTRTTKCIEPSGKPNQPFIPAMLDGAC